MATLKEDCRYGDYLLTGFRYGRMIKINERNMMMA